VNCDLGIVPIVMPQTTTLSKRGGLMRKIVLLVLILVMIATVQVGTAFASYHAAGYVNASDSFGGGYVEWAQLWYPDPGSLSGNHNNHTLWFWTDGTNGYSYPNLAFVGVGYWHGYLKGEDWNGFYWERMTKDNWWDIGKVTSVAPGSNGTNHSFEVVPDYVSGYQGYYGYIDSTQVFQFQQAWPSKKMQVGLESSRNDQALGHTYPSYMEYKSSGNWLRWSYGAIRKESNSPYSWAWRNNVYYLGDDWR